MRRSTLFTPRRTLFHLSAIITVFCVRLSPAYADAGTPYSLTATLTGTTVTVAWTAPVGHSTTDWVALYTPGTADTDYNSSGASYRYLSAATSGALTFTAPTTPGIYEARLFRNNGYEKVAASASFTVGGKTNLPPTVTLQWPQPTQPIAVGDRVKLEAEAADADGAIAQVQFFVSGAPIGPPAFNPPYRAWWTPTSRGTYVVTAVATDISGLSTTSAAVTVTVSSATATPPPPSGQMPSSYAVSATPATVPPGGTLTVQWTRPPLPEFLRSRGDQIGLYRVGASARKPLSAQDVGAALEGTLSFTMPETPGTYEFRYFYIDAIVSLDPPVGDPRRWRPTKPRPPRTIYVVLATSKPVTVASSTNQPPSVRLLSPAAGATFTAPATITLTATASDPDGTIAKVEFFQGATLLGAATSSPYTFTWPAVAAGPYTLTAKATDNMGASVTSEPVSITVTTKSLEPSQALQTVANNYALIADLKADMTVSTVLDLQPFGEDSYCRYAFKRPDREKVETYASTARTSKTDVIIIQGSTMNLINPLTHERQTIDLLADAKLSAPQWNQMDLYYNAPSFIDSHTLTINEAETDTGNGIITIEAVPKSPSPLYSKLKLSVDTSKGLLVKTFQFRENELQEKLEVLESQRISNGAWVPIKLKKTPMLTSGNMASTLTFSNVQVNVGLTDADFDPTRQ